MTKKNVVDEPKQSWWMIPLFALLLISSIVSVGYFTKVQKSREGRLTSVIAQELIVIGAMRLSQQSANFPSETAISQPLSAEIREICNKNKAYFEEMIGQTIPNKDGLIRKFSGMCSDFDSKINRAELTYGDVLSSASALNDTVAEDVALDDAAKKKDGYAE